MKQVMIRAWEIAKEGQKKFGGKVSEYLSEALKMAWAEVKAPKTVTVKTTSGSKQHKSWIAMIVGTHPKWKLDRQFVNPTVKNDWDGKVYELSSGIYEVCDAGDREFIKVENGEIEYMEYTEIVSMIA